MTLTKIEALSRQENLKINTYDIVLDLANATSSKTFASTSTVTFTSQIDETFIDITADSITSLTVNGQLQEIKLSDNKLKLTNLSTTEVNTVTVEAQCLYSSSGEGLHKYQDPEDKRFYLYTQYEPFDAHRVYACFDQPSLKGKWAFQISAPEGWTVLSNQAETSQTTEDGVTVHKYAQTLPLSSYITCVIAGEYARVDGSPWQGAYCDSKQLIPLSLYCRQSLLEHLDSEDIFRVTCQGFDFFHQKYGFAYPWGKYDQIFVPEYNLGAMENPGCVTFTESYIVRGGPSHSQRASRANTILHEMCHMWFGDLATPAWWDDLWLKESFADHQGTFALAAATEYTDSWTTFALKRKGWAYLQDQRPTTHPIMADIPDLDAAKQNFDGITYAKGASVLKQLMAYVGEDAFFQAAQSYFAKHAFTATSFTDLIEALAQASSVSSEELENWVKTWLQTAGPSEIKVKISDGQLCFTQSVPELEGVTSGVIRPHRFSVATYYSRDQKLELGQTYNILLEGSSVTVPLQGDLPDLVIPNVEDSTYAIFRFDDASLKVLSKQIECLPTSLSRAVSWQNLWLAVYDGLLDPMLFVRMVGRASQVETNLGLLENCLDYALTALTRFIPAPACTGLVSELQAISKSVLGTELGVDTARIWTQFRLSLGAIFLPAEEVSWVQKVASNTGEFPPFLIWAAVNTLAAQGKISATEIDQITEWDKSGEGSVLRAQAWASLPDSEVKSQAWREALSDNTSNDRLSALLAGMNRQTHQSLLQPYVDAFYAQVLDYWNHHSIGMGTRFVHGAFPAGVVYSPEGAPEITDHPVIYATDTWLQKYADAPHALRRLMIEHREAAYRNLKVQKRYYGA